MCRYRGSLAGERDSLESCYLRKQRTCNSKVATKFSSSSSSSSSSCYLRKQRTCNSKVATKVRNSHHYHHHCHCHCHHHYTLVIGRNTEIAKVVVATIGRCSIWFQLTLSLPKYECFFKHHHFPLFLHNYHLFSVLFLLNIMVTS